MTSLDDMKFVVDCSGIANHWGLLSEFWWSFDRARRDDHSIVQSAHYALQEWDVYPYDIASLTDAEGFGNLGYDAPFITNNTETER